MERSLSLLTDRIEVLRAAVRRARAQHPFQNIPAAEGATLFRPTVMKMCRYLCLDGGGAPERGAGTRLRDATEKAHNSTRISGALHPAAGSHPSASRWNLFRPPRARGRGPSDVTQSRKAR